MDINQFLTWFFEDHNFLAAVLLPFWTMLYSAWKGYALQAALCFVIWIFWTIGSITKKSSH
jgi:hypothetical protein